MPADIPSAIYTAPFETFAPRPVPPLVTPELIKAAPPILSIYGTLEDLGDALGRMGKWPPVAGSVSWSGGFPTFQLQSDWQAFLKALYENSFSIFRIGSVESEIVIENGQYTVRKLPSYGV